jgi:hypothetical protein
LRWSAGVRSHRLIRDDLAAALTKRIDLIGGYRALSTTESQNSKFKLMQCLFE